MVSFWLLPMLATMAAIRAANPGGDPRLPRPQVHSLVLWTLVAIPSTVQFFQPALLETLRRDWPLIEQGQVWRLITSTVVQDGGLVGTLFNLSILAIVLLGAQTCWSAPRIWATFWLGAIAANLVVGPSLNPVGAGNSMATFVLAVALAVASVRVRSSRLAMPPAIGALACVAVMVLARNYHGYAALLGIAPGLVPGGRDKNVRGRD